MTRGLSRLQLLGEPQDTCAGKEIKAAGWSTEKHREEKDGMQGPGVAGKKSVKMRTRTEIKTSGISFSLKKQVALMQRGYQRKARSSQGKETE